MLALQVALNNLGSAAILGSARGLGGGVDEDREGCALPWGSPRTPVGEAPVTQRLRPVPRPLLPEDGQHGRRVPR